MGGRAPGQGLVLRTPLVVVGLIGKHSIVLLKGEIRCKMDLEYV